MAVIGTFGSYTAARLAIYSSQAAMNVTGNNIGNINTTGYTRQRTDQCSMYSVGTPRYQNSYNINIGYGAMVENVSQLRDPYLDIRFRNENASLGYHEAMQDGLAQISHILDEVGKGEDDFGMIEAKLGDLKNALRDLMEYPGSTQHDDLVSAAASTLCRLLNSAAKELEEVRKNEENKMMESVNDVNRILSNIRDLNEQIRTQAIYGGNALELRDARNVQIDKLSKYMKLTVTYSTEKLDGGLEIEKLSLSLNGTKDPNTGKEFLLVDGIYATQFQTPKTTPTLNPNYDPSNPKGMQFWDSSANKPTNDVRNARKLNATYNKSALPYLAPERDKDGNETGKYIPTTSPYRLVNEGSEQEPHMVRVPNKINSACYQYVADKPADSKNPPAGVIETFDENGNTIWCTEDPRKATILYNKLPNNTDSNTQHDSADPAGYKYLAVDPTKLDPPVAAGTENDPPNKDYKILDGKDGNFYTNIPEYGIPRDNFIAGEKDNLYLFRLDALRDSRDRVMFANTDDESLPADLGDNDLFGSLQAMRELLTEEAEFSSTDDLQRDPNAATKRGIPFYQHMLDSFAQQFAKTFNDANQMAGTDMKKIYKLDAAGQNFMTKDNKVIMSVNDLETLYNKIQDPANSADYKGYPQDDTAYENYQKDVQTYQGYLDTLREQGQLTDDYDFYDGGVLFSNDGNSNDPTGITAANISVSNSWADGSVRVLNTKQANLTYIDEDGNTKKLDSKTLNDNLAHIMSLVDQKMEYMTTDTVRDSAADSKAFFTGNFQEMFGRSSALLGADSQASIALYSSFSITTLDLDNDRISVSGVDLNEEATNMMQYSQSFSAACRLLTTIDQMLDTLINNTLR